MNDLVIGAVEGITGLTWTEVTIGGQAAHAGTTPMHLRRDAGYAAAEIAVFVRRLAQSIAGNQKGTVARIELFPNLVNVVGERAVLTVDLRNTDAARLQEAEQQLVAFLDRLAAQEQVSITTRSLARFDPVIFPADMVSLVETTAHELGLSCRRLPSGAGHDAQMMARICPASMIFVPSVGGLSHNVREHTKPSTWRPAPPCCCTRRCGWRNEETALGFDCPYYLRTRSSCRRYSAPGRSAPFVEIGAHDRRELGR